MHKEVKPETARIIYIVVAVVVVITLIFGIDSLYNPARQCTNSGGVWLSTNSFGSGSCKRINLDYLLN